MASNFNITVHRNRASLQLILAGDFDGTSACELLNILAKECGNARSVVIHTDGLKDIYPFGQDTFQNNLYTLKNRSISLSFIGKNAAQIAPDGVCVFGLS